MKKNCWEFKKCGRQEGGEHVHDLGICPAAVMNQLHGVHDGINAGRACWLVAGTMCGEEVQGTFAQKYGHCELCDFYQTVQMEEEKLILSISVLKRMRTDK